MTLIPRKQGSSSLPLLLLLHVYVLLCSPTSPWCFLHGLCLNSEIWGLEGAAGAAVQTAFLPLLFLFSLYQNQIQV